MTLAETIKQDAESLVQRAAAVGYRVIIQPDGTVKVAPNEPQTI